MISYKGIEIPNFENFDIPIHVENRNFRTKNTDKYFELSYDEAVNFVLESRRASISAVQRKLRIGYNRAARLIETMEEAGLVSEMSSNGSREVLVPKRD